MKKLISIIILISIYINVKNVFSQKTTFVTLGSIAYDISQIPIDSKLKLVDTIREISIKDNVYHVSIIENLYASFNKKFFLKESIRYLKPIGLSHFLEEPEVELTYFEKKGNKVWVLNTIHILNQCKISNDGKLVHLSIDKGLDSLPAIHTFNKSGNLVCKIDSIFESRFIPNIEGDLLFYNKKINDSLYKFMIDFKDIENIKKEKINFGEFYNVSANGERILYWKNDSIYLMSRNNKLLWQKPFASNSMARISPDGEQTIILKDNWVTLIDNANSNIIFSKKIRSTHYDNIEFIDNSKMISVFEIQNNGMKIHLLNTNGNYVNIFKCKNKYTYSIYLKLNGEEVDLYIDGLKSNSKLKITEK